MAWRCRPGWIQALWAASLSIALAAVAFAQRAEPLPIGSPAPDLDLNDANGNPHSLRGYAKAGKPVAVIFWSYRCPICRAYAERLRTLQADFADRLQVLAVDSNDGETPDGARDEALHQGLDFPILFDPDGRAADRFGAEVTPQAFLVAADGTLVYRGAIDDDVGARSTPDQRVGYLRQAIAATLAGKPVPRGETRHVGCSIKRKR